MSSAYSIEAAKRVASGMELLDEKIPGWTKKIELESLNIAFSHDCILGQLFGNYLRGLRHLSLKEGDNFGFDSGEHASDETIYITQSDLIEAWKNAIRKRRRKRH